MTSDFQPYPFEFRRHPPPATRPDDARVHPVVIVGGGIAGLTLELGLAVQGVASVVIEADETVCFGSRAICFSRRSLEIFERLGVLAPILGKGLAWTGGRSFYRNTEVLHFQMPHDRLQKLPPMINLQQYWVEESLVRALEARTDRVDLRWQSRVTAVREEPDHVALTIEEPGRRFTLRAAWVVACDGARSRVREALGLRLEGTAYEGRYVVADIALACDLPTERLAWFDPPSNPGSTILMHRQPDDIWRIDYQLRDDEDGQAAVEPTSVLPRVSAHLRMIGLDSEWAPLWISLYKANALTLPRYRHGRCLFAGDAAHLVPIFGVRGANSTIDDADNLAWKLACLVRGQADAALLDSYSDERVQAAHENLAYGRKSTQFMAPPDFAFRAMREAVLGLAVDTPALRPLINPRQSSPVRYERSPLNATESGTDGFTGGPAAGTVLVEAPLRWLGADGKGAEGHLTDALRAGTFTLIDLRAMSATWADAPAALAKACRRLRADGIAARRVEVRTVPGMNPPVSTEPGTAPDCIGLDLDGSLAARYGVPPEGALYAVRPDGHVLGRWPANGADVGAAAEAAIRRCLAGGSARAEGRA
jgi:3-(3-hydroxy-phenyl)propionate hydroxylase